MTTIHADTCSLTEFRRSARAHLKRLKESGQPEMLTVDGKPELVVQALESYERLLDIVDRAEAVQGIRRGLESMARGQGLPAREACEKLRARHGIDPDA